MKFASRITPNESRRMQVRCSLLCVNRRIHRRLILNSYILNSSFVAFDFIEYEIESIMNFFFILLLSFRGYGIESMSLSRHTGFYPDRSPLAKRVLINGGYHLEAIFYVPHNNETIAINCAPNCNDRQIGSIGAFPGSSWTSNWQQIACSTFLLCINYFYISSYCVLSA